MNQRQVIGLIGLLVVAVLAGVGITVYSVLKSAMSPSTSTATAGSMFDDATGLVPIFEGRLGEEWLVSARKLSIKPRGAELITQREGIARRYNISPNAGIQRRGGASLVAAEPFDLRTLDMSLVPGMIAEARERTGVGIMRLVVGRDEEGLLLWRAEASGAADVYYYADGSYVEDPNDP